MSDFENRAGRPRWRAMGADQRKEAGARAVTVVADLLDDPDRGDFLNHPVTVDGRDLPWHVCDRALTMAWQAGGARPVFDRWRSMIPRAQAEYDAQVRAWERGQVEFGANRSAAPWQRARARGPGAAGGAGGAGDGQGAGLMVPTVSLRTGLGRSPTVRG